MELTDTEEKAMYEGLNILARILAKTIIRENLLGEQFSREPGRGSLVPQTVGESFGDHDKRLVLSVPEAAELLGLSTPTAYQAVNAGKIPNIRIGRRILIPRAALLKFLSETSADK